MISSGITEWWFEMRENARSLHCAWVRVGSSLNLATASGLWFQETLVGYYAVRKILSFFICVKVAAVKRLMSEPRTPGWRTATLWSSLLFSHTWEFCFCPDNCHMMASSVKADARLGWEIFFKVYFAPVVVCCVPPLCSAMLYPRSEQKQSTRQHVS